ncbi:hypothetical protein ACWEDF_32070, partial [Micromonospora chersina]
MKTATDPGLAKGPGPAAVPPRPAARSRRVPLLRVLPLTPAVVLLLLFLAGPIAYCAYIAFTDLQLTGQAEDSFVGFENFT